MKIKLLLILFTIAISSPILGQYKFVDENYDCNLLYEELRMNHNSNIVDSILATVHCLIIRNQFQNGMRILDSLSVTNPKNGEFLSYKAMYYYLNNVCDTSYFSFQRAAIKLNYDLGTSTYNLGSYYLNFVTDCESDTLKIKPGDNKKLELLELADMNFRSALKLDKKVKMSSLYCLAYVNEEKAKIKKHKIEDYKYTNNFDTLTIIAELRDCGEFGGHLEYIKCYHSENNLVATFSQDEVFCEQGEKPERNPDIMSKQGEQPVDSIMLKNYIQHFNGLELDPYLYTNGPTSFCIIVGSNIYFKRDGRGNSEEYIKFRNEIFK